MAASERARELIDAALSSYWNAGARYFHFDHQGTSEQAKKDRAALLAYVARLEACVAAARVMANAVYAPSLTNDVKAALAALDRPEDGQ